MKTILIVLGALFVASRLSNGGPLFTISGSAIPTTGASGSPFGTTPAGGSAGTIILPQNDPYQNTYTAGGGGGSGIPVDPGVQGGAGGSGFFAGYARPTAPIIVRNPGGTTGPIRSRGYQFKAS